jgi:hypothetical protein
MQTNELPKQDMATSETGCCPKFEPKSWEGETITFDKKLFVKAKTINLLHIPLNMGSVITKTSEKIQKAGAGNKDEFVMLSTDPSPWRGEHYFAVKKDVPDAEMVNLSGTYLTKVFEGPFKEAGKWVKQTQDYIKSKGKELEQLYFYYTTCPKCAKHYGKNYVVAFAQV